LRQFTVCFAVRAAGEGKNMKVKVKNLGILKQAEFEVGDLTVICGRNNTGKTYATYALYGFLVFWNEGYRPKLLKKEDVEKLLTDGSVQVSMENIRNQANSIVAKACKDYLRTLPVVFATSDDAFNSSEFSVTLAEGEIKSLREYNQLMRTKEKPLLNVTKKRDEEVLTASLMFREDDAEAINKDFIEEVINRHVLSVAFGNTFPSPFIASAERTGAAIFRKELDFSRNRLLDHMNDNKKKIDPMTLLNTFFDRGYALPVNRDVDFVRFAEDVVKRESVIAKDNPEIVSSFREILGGEYKADKDAVYFVPKRNVRLKLGESASSVRSLLDVGLYIRHAAKPGDFFMIDEPELNLHPANQRNMAQLLARLVNAGVRVFITTHSDYIVKEFNTLIMLNRGGQTAACVMKEYAYCADELLDAQKIRIYVAREELTEVEGASRRQKCNTFVPAPVGEYGIEVDSFDETINVQNDIQRELMFGED
jgi:AAA15 family ATPase/GTPase